MSPQPMPERSAQGGEQLNVPQAPQAVPPAAPQGVPAAQPAPMPDLSQVPGPAPVPGAAPASAQPTANPATAADVDVIEKEWVDKAEEAIHKTAGDPHAEEEAVEDLQIDYMKKRYNKDIKKSND